MFDTLKAEFDTEKEFLNNEIVRLTKELEEELEEMDDIENKISQYRSEYSVATKYEKDDLRSHLIRSNSPNCPRCLIRTDSHNEMTPKDKGADYDLFYCKLCGWEFESNP